MRAPSVSLNSAASASRLALTQPAGVTDQQPRRRLYQQKQPEKPEPAQMDANLVGDIVRQALEITAQKLAGDASYKAEVARRRIDAARKPATALSMNRDFMGNPKPGTFDPINHGGQS